MSAKETPLPPAEHLIPYQNFAEQLSWWETLNDIRHIWNAQCDIPRWKQIWHRWCGIF